MKMTRRSSKLLATVAAVSLVFAACGGDDDSGDVTDSTTETTDSGATDTATDADGTTEDTTEDTGDGTSAAPVLTAEPGEVGGSGCGTPHGPYDPAEAAGEVRIAWNDPLLSFNNNTSHANATANANIQYLTQSGFNYYNGDLELVNNDSFGICKIESLDPLTITYYVNEGVTWSDGTPIDAADMMLYWASQSSVFNEGGVTFLEDGSAIQTDEDGNWLVTTPDGTVEPEAPGVSYDPETFELYEGYAYIPAEGVNFDAASEQYALVTQTPVITADGQGVTMTYDSFYVDYAISAPFLQASPAHVVGRLALGIDDPMEAKQAIIDAFVNNDGDAIAPIANTFNTAFDATSLPDDEGIYLSSGMYQVTAYDELSEITLEVNPSYNWGPMPKVQTLIYRIIGDPTAALQALANEEIDVMSPQATVDFVDQLNSYADRGIVAIPYPSGTYEHVDLVPSNGGPFDPASYGGDEATALAVRQALLKTIPRADIVERLIGPIDPEAAVRDSFTQTPGSPPYANLAENNGLADYADVDIEGAIALLADAGVATPINVRVHFADNNPRRASEYELMAASAAEAGFNLIDGRSPRWGSELTNTSIYDMVFFGWQSTAVAITDSEANYVTGGQNNFYGYSNETVDALFDELKQTTDPARQQEILLEVEQNLTADAFGLPLFQFPEVAAYNSNYVSNVDPIAIAPTILWNVWDWEAA
jgi:peptide/nickel transport system substrate-binding protein